MISQLEMARAELRAQLIERGEDPDTSQVTPFVCEDRVHVVIFARYNDDSPPYSCVKLDRPVETHRQDRCVTNMIVGWFAECHRIN